MSDTWRAERIARKRTIIVVLEDAIEKLALGESAVTYSLDDGQTRVTKQAADLNSLRLALAYHEQKLGELEADCRPATHGVPGF